MQMRTMLTFGSKVGGMAWKAAGLALVLTALATSAMAIDGPEIDPGSMTSALALLSGGMLMLADRRRRK